MNNNSTLVSICIYSFVFFSGIHCTWAAIMLSPAKSIEQVPLKITPHQVKSVYLQLLSRKDVFDAASTDYEKAYELITDPVLVEKLLSLRYSLGLAIDKNMLSSQQALQLGYEPLEQVKNKPNRYRLNYQRYSYLANPELLFSISYDDNGFFVEHDLIERGFCQKDILILKDYIKATKPYELVTRDNLRHVGMHLNELKYALGKETFKDKDAVIRFFKTYEYYNQYNRHNVWLNWGLGLLSKFDAHRQRILKSYLLERLSSDVLSIAAPQTLSIDFIKIAYQQEIDDIRSGRINQRIVEALNDEK